MNLIYRKRKYFDESFPDYLGRLAYWNGYRDSEVLVVSLINLYKDIAGGYDISEKERKKLSDFNVEYKRHNLKWYKSRVALEFVLREYFPLSELNLYEAPPKRSVSDNKICRKCWEKNSYVRFYWREGCYKVCHLHSETLIKVKSIPYGTSVSSLTNDFDIDAFKYNCKITKAILESRIKMGCSLSDLHFEMAVAIDEISLWGRVQRFLKSRFLWEIDVERYLDIQLVAGLSIPSRLESVISKLHFENKPQEKLLRVVLILQIVRYNFLIKMCSTTWNWILSESYSLSPFLYSYIKGVKSNLFASNEMTDNYVVYPVSFLSFSDRQLCKFIIESSIFTSNELKNFYKGGKSYSTGVLEPRGILGRMEVDYDKYKDATGKNVFDIQPAKRKILA
ncbi:hypothetical protein ACJJIG_10580 [Microbulbifer sp. SSSA007]|uniref:hypothetical protein n=1 Tax=Microbulbifer sp. SSSA007 TaxID=3243379 RepID=UPI00403A6952